MVREYPHQRHLPLLESGDRLTRPEFELTWLGVYQSLTPGVDLSDAATVRLDRSAVEMLQQCSFVS
ncbi:hypothetical protein [Nostoc sp.]|uniref:hypothetical protein n=1 Tax=Nostoc sp. TaxID=1180 RepID=UPI003FA5ACCC